MLGFSPLGDTPLSSLPAAAGGPAPISGDGACSFSITSAGAGQLAIAGAGSANIVPASTGAGVLAIAGTGTGSIPITGAGDDSLFIQGTGAGQFLLTGSGTGQLGIVGATGTQPIIPAGASQGALQIAGNAAAQFTIVGTGDGNTLEVRQADGSATFQIVSEGTGTVANPPQETAAGPTGGAFSNASWVLDSRNTRPSQPERWLRAVRPPKARRPVPAPDPIQAFGYAAFSLVGSGTGTLGPAPRTPIDEPGLDLTEDEELLALVFQALA